MQNKVEFGDVVRAKCSAPARAISSTKCLFVSSMCNDLGIDNIDFDVSWDSNNLPLPSDKDLKNYRTVEEAKLEITKDLIKKVAGIWAKYFNETTGALQNITGYDQISGNFAIAGTGTFSTGTGAISLNGATSVTGTNTFTYTMSGTPASNATGTPTARLDGAGWTKPLTGTGLAAFLQGTGESWARYLRVDDTVGASARLIGYESMSDINNGAGLFPTAALLPSGAYMTKSATTDAVVRAWVLVATERWFTLIINQSGTATASSIMSFGDIASYVSGDQYKTILIASNSATVNTSNYGYGGLALHTAAPTNEAKCIARPYTGVGSGVKVNLTGALSVATNMTFIGNGATTAMNGSAGGTTSIVDGALYQSPIMVTESSAYRGMLPEPAGAEG